MPNPQIILESYKKQINKSLESFFNGEMLANRHKDIFFRNSLKNLKHYHLRSASKRIRAILVILGYTLFRKKATRQILEIARSVELIHSSLLIHDDIIDNDKLRRGGPSAHYFFEKLHRKNYIFGEAKHFGISMGILSGDVGFAEAYRIIIESHFPENLKTKVLTRFNQMYFDTCYGEMMDVVHDYQKKVSFKDILEVYRYKTAKYTIECPLQIGAILAGQNQKQLNLLSKFAIPLGVAFQIQDDVLGMFGDEKTIGKPVTSDLEEGKKTLLMVYALARANKKQRQLLMKYFGHKNIKISDLNKVRQTITETGALKYCHDYAKILVSRSKKALVRLKKANRNTLFLLNYLADYIIKRNY